MCCSAPLPDAPGEPPLGARRAQTTITPAAAGERLDHWLARRFTYHARTAWQRLIAAGQVRVNGAPVRAARLLRAGDVVEYLPDDVPEPPVATNVEIVARGPGWLALNKPANLPCHPGGRYFRHTLWGLLRERYGAVSLVHRLDRETSGLVLVGTEPAAAASLARTFAAGRARKEYLAIVAGDFPATAHAAGFLAPDPRSPVAKKRRYFAADPGGGEAAETDFSALGRGAGLSLVSCRPATGRLHQLRATLEALGYPIIGDKLYGPDPALYLRFARGGLSAADVARLRLSRQALHAWRLRLVLPGAGDDERELEASLPADLVACLHAAAIPWPLAPDAARPRLS